MRIRQAMFGACVAAALVFGTGAGPAGETSAAPAMQLCALSMRTVQDRILTVVLDAAGEIEARLRQF